MARTAIIRSTALLVSVTLVLLAVSQSQAVADECADTEDPCCMAGLVQGSGPSGTHTRFGRPSWMHSCLREVRVEGSAATATAQTVLNNFNNMYAFRHLVEDSSATEAMLPGDLAVTPTVHSVAADVGGLVQAALQNSRMADDPPQYHSAYSFHYGMAAALRTLNDPNTAYMTPFGDWSLHRVVDLVPHTRSDGTLEFHLEAALGWTDSLLPEGAVSPAIYEAVHGSPAPDTVPFLGYAVTAVNGLPVEDYLQQRADARGEARSASNRLASLLATKLPGTAGESLAGGPPPGSDEEVFTFSGGISEAWKLTVRYSGAAQGRQDLENIYSDASPYDSLHAAFVAVEQTFADLWGEPCMGCYPSEARTAPVPGSAGLADRFEAWAASAEGVSAKLLGLAGSPEGVAEEQVKQDSPARAGEADSGDHFYCDYGDCDYSDEEYDYGDFVDLETKAVAEDIELVAQFHAGVPFSNSAPFLGVYRASSVRSIVLKINSFKPEGGAFAPKLGALAASSAPLLRSLRDAMTLASDLAKQHGYERLLLDVSSAVDEDEPNRSTVAALFLLKLLLPDWSASPSLLCDTTAVRVSPLTSFLAKGAESSTAALRTAIAAAPEGDDLMRVGLAILQTAEAMSRLLEGLPSSGGESRSLTTVVSDVLTSVPPIKAQLEDSELMDDEKRALIDAFVRDKVGSLSTAAAQLALGGGGIPYIPESGRPFSGIDHWHNTSSTGEDNNYRGNADVYSQLFHTAVCREAAEAPALEEGVTHEFQKVVLLTDGVCSGACSTLTTRLALSGAVWTVSHGAESSLGDIAPTGRGGQGRWHDLALATVYAYVMHVLLGAQPEPLPGEVDFTHLPGPLPSMARVRYATDAVYEPYLGERALPREFYSLAADVHVPFQAVSPGTLPQEDDARSTGILRVWDICFPEFSLAPLLNTWRLPPSKDSDGGDDGNDTDAAKVVAVSATIVFNDMLMIDVTQEVREMVRARVAKAAGLRGTRVVIISTVPGSVVWNVSAVFPATETEQIDEYEQVLNTDLLSVFREELLLVRYGPEQTAAAVHKTEAASFAAYLDAALSSGGGGGGSTSAANMSASYGGAMPSLLHPLLLLSFVVLIMLMR